MTRSPAFRATLLAALAVIAPLGRAADSASVRPAPTPRRSVLLPGSRRPEPAINPASDDGRTAIQRMKLADGLELKLWAAEPMLANPVSFNIDERGRIFVTETYRYRTSAFDIRDYRWLLEEDLASRRIEDRAATLMKHFGPEGVAELSIESEIVRLLEDTDGDGVADRTSVYADGFNTPLDGIASGILIRRGEVWFANIPSIWKFTGGRRAETRTEISRGFGVRFSFTGHDLHGLIWGPDGKIYFSFGDRGAHVKTKEGKILDTPDMGAVYRMNPDGSQMEIVADGMRNPQSLLFTENGDLFTGDNDSDMGDEERLVHVVEGGDSGWRIGYQHSPLAAVERIGPWSAEKMWQPRHENQPAFILPPICNIEDGPSGIAYYPGTGLNAAYFGSIFITHFKGAVARSGIYTYNVKPSGASYEIADSKPFLTAALPTDVRFGPDGRLYLCDWVDGFPQSRRGRIYAISDPAHVNDPLVKETQQLIGGDWTKRPSDKLAQLLGHADWRVRLEAQYTLAERGDASISVFARVATTAARAAGQPGNPANLPAYARRHAIWGLGQLAAKNNRALAPLRPLLRDADPEVRAQAIKVLGDHRQTGEADNFIAALKDGSPRVKFFAALGLGKISAAQPALADRTAPALLGALRANNDVDAYVRHACVMGLVGGRNIPAITAAIGDRSRAVRMGSLLALRRLARPEIARFLRDPDPRIVREAALAINDAPIDAAMPELAALLETPTTDEAVLYRAINANYRLGRTSHAAALVKFALRPDAPTKFRAEAITQLGLWSRPPARDRVVGVFRPYAAPEAAALVGQSRDYIAARSALSPFVSALLDASAPAAIQTAAIIAVEKLEIATAADTLYAVVRDEAQPVGNRASALATLNKFDDPRLPEAAKIASESASSALRLAALPVAARLAPAAAAPVIANFIAKGSAAEQKAAFETLGTLKHASADLIFSEQIGLLAAGKIAPAVQLELLEGAAKRDDPGIKKLLAERELALAADPDPLAAFRFALQGGDRGRGQLVFEGHPVMACVRCHRIGTGAGGDAGPNLADIGNKSTRELILESIVKPNARISPGFDVVVVTRKSGGVVAGIVVTETDDAVTLRDPEGRVAEVKKSDIAKREGAPSAMPEIYATLLTKAELRDVVEYVAGIRSFGGGGRGGPGRVGFGGGRGDPGALPPPRALRGITPPPARPPE
ncbi:MAG: heme-binding protein [Opitutus sp.]|nr:heme-binding protein [Opitutus sp.]